MKQFSGVRCTSPHPTVTNAVLWDRDLNYEIDPTDISRRAPTDFDAAYKCNDGFFLETEEGNTAFRYFLFMTSRKHILYTVEFMLINLRL